MPRALKFRLSLMMFLEYVATGAVIPILSHYLKDNLHFEPRQWGQILSMPAVAAIVAPFITAHIADRFISAERLLALCHLCCGMLMLLLTQQTTFWSFWAVYFAYGLLFAPTYGLTNTVALHHVADARRDFGGVRMWGTASWVVVGWTFGLFWLNGNPDRLRHALFLSAFASFTVSLYALTLPSSAPHKDKPKTLAYWKSLEVFAHPSVLLLSVLSLFNSASHMFYYYGISRHLNQTGFPNNHLLPAISSGQASEVIVLFVLGSCIARLGMKNILVLGAFAQVIRYVLFAFGHGTPASLYLGICLHGFCYAFWFTAGYLYVDAHSTKKTRAGAQQLFTIIVTGAGAAAGYYGAGLIGQYFSAPGTGIIDFSRFWQVPLWLSFLCLVVMLIFFREEPPEHTGDSALRAECVNPEQA